MRKVILYSIFVYSGLTLIYRSGYKKTSERDYLIDMQDSTIAIPNQPIDTSIIHKPDTTKYKGNWVDPN